MRIIRDSEELASFCAAMARAPFVCVDTEFMRDTTYWPKLGLIQIAGPEGEAIVDPLADALALAPFFDLLRAAGTVKVFHAARQDVEIFWHMAQAIPEPMFDTQVAAMVCGFGDSVGYETLIRKLAKAEIDKSARFTDWSRRPLSDKQLAYALSDVTHLRTAYEALAAQLAREQRASWLDEEMAVLRDPNTYRLDPADAWRRLKLRGGNRRFMGVARAVAAWREIQAQERDIPRQRVLKDDAVVEIASQAPRTAADLDGLRAVPKGFANSRFGASLLSAVQAGLAAPFDPPAEPRASLPPNIGPLADLLKLLLKICADQHNVAARLIASSEDIDLLAADDAPDIPALHGWRREVFGQAAIDLKAGRIALAAKGRRAALVPVA